MSRFLSRSWRYLFLASSFLLLAGSAARAQSTLNEQLRKVLTDPEAMKELEKTKNLAPVELFKTQILPNDVLPYVKPNHWATSVMELRSNQIDYAGSMETLPLHLEGMPQDVIFHREARLPKGKRTRLSMPLMLARIPKEVGVQLRRPEAIREDELWNFPLRLLEPHQMLIPVLTKGSNDAYNRLNAMRVMVPLSAMHGDPVMVDRQRYYRFVLPGDPAQPLLPTHPLAWTTISHIVWDGMAPETLSIGQQEAMLDWIHWGGQLIIVGSAGPSFAPLKESFLGPYLPADGNGGNALLKTEDLAEFSKKFSQYSTPQSPEELLEGTQTYQQLWQKAGRRYAAAPAPLRIENDKPLYLTGMTPRPGSTAISVGRANLPPIGVEARVGRGRILMIGLNLVEPTLLAWPGYETFVRRVVLRRIEERQEEQLRYAPNGAGFYAPRYEFLNGPGLTWTRIHSRDLGAPVRQITPEDESEFGRISARQPNTNSPLYNPIDFYQVPVAEWLDSAALPSLSRKSLDQASGIEIPNSRFVLKVILAYLICLVPLNWLICRFGLGKREWAWVLVPVLAFGFAIVVERAAAYDVGYESTCDEINVLETHGDYGRGHISRFGSLYTTGRVKFSISYPDDPTALVLPMSTGRSIRGEDVHESRFQIQPFPALTDYLVQPRSLSMYRAEQLAPMPGTVHLVKQQDGSMKVVNDGPLDLKNAVLIEMKRKGSTYRELGTIATKASVEVKGESLLAADYLPPEELPAAGEKNTLSPANFLAMLVNASQPNGPEDVGEIRLVAWSEKLIPGQLIDPPVDRQRGFTLVVAHLRPGDVPDPDSIEYNALALGVEKLPEKIPQPPQQPSYGPFMRGPGMMGGAGAPGMPGAAPVPPGAVPKNLRLPPGAMPTPAQKKAAESDPSKSKTDPADDEIQSEDYSSEKPRR